MNWIQTKAGLQMAETIIRHLPKLSHPGTNPEIQEAMIVIQKYLPRITVCLEELAKEKDGKKILYTEVKDSNLSYVLTEDISKIGKKLKEGDSY